MIDISAEVTVALVPVLEELRQVRLELAEVKASLPPRFVSLKEAARAMGVDTRTIAAMAARGELVTRRAGRRVLVDAASLRPLAREMVAELVREARS